MRSRNIKPGFFKNELLIECSPDARLLFVGLWCFADCEGRFEWRPLRIKAEIFPFENKNIEELLNQLIDKELIIKYTIKNKEYGCVVNFKKHQNPHPKEKKSELPAPPEKGNDIKYKASQYLDHDKDVPRSLQESLIPDILIPDILIPEVIDKSITSQNREAAQLKFLGNAAFTEQQEILDYWNAAFLNIKGVSKSGSLLVKDRKGIELVNHINAAMAKYKSDKIIQAISNYKEIIRNPDVYWYNQKYTLGEFLSYGVRNGKGFVQFLNEKQPLVVFKKGYKRSDTVPNTTTSCNTTFSPITVKFTKIFDENKKTFYGFSFDKLKDFESKIRDMNYIITTYTEGAYFQHVGYFRELEFMIAGLLFNRKRLLASDKKEYFDLRFKKCMELWVKYKEIYKIAAEEMKNNE